MITASFEEKTCIDNRLWNRHQKIKYPTVTTMKIFCQKPFKPEKNQNLRKAYCQKTLFARHMKQYEATKLKPNKPKKKKTKKGGKILRNQWVPLNLNTQTRTQKLFSVVVRRNLRAIGRNILNQKKRKNKKSKKNLTLKTGTFSPHLISFLSFNHRENLSTLARRHYHLNRWLLFYTDFPTRDLGGTAVIDWQKENKFW